MQNVYTTELLPSHHSDTDMKSPRKSTINFLRNFARAYAFTAATGALVFN